MGNTVVVGAQWGDEAKGKLVDYLAGKASMVVRYGGGSNAGHTVMTHGKTYKFHLVPCGILYPAVTCVIADGVVIDPGVLVDEIDGLIEQGLSVSNLKISANAHVIMPYHRLFDQLEEARKGQAAIGTTGRGIGPAYSDKAARTGIRMHELIDAARFEARAREQIELKNLLLTRIYDAPPLDADAVISSYAALAEKLRPFVTDTVSLIGRAHRDGGNIVFEGAQGSLLDLDLGTYPYVTSSHPIAGGACIGTGVGPNAIGAVVGVAKAYTTRVGSGVFPTEQDNDIGHYIRERGHEYGTTTGRPRRCGWLDAVVLKYSVQVNGMTCLSLGHLDVLSGLDNVLIGVRYRIGGVETDELPIDLPNCTDLETIYETLPGWREDVTGAKTYYELPRNCKAFIKRVEQLLGIPVVSVSVGPNREQLIIISDKMPGGNIQE